MKNVINKIGAGLSVLPVLLLPSAAFAQLSEASTNLGDIGSSGSFDVESDLPTIIGGIINALLGVLGIIFLVLTVYAGFVWMMSGGDADKVKKAKQMLTNSVIGLVIVVAAYAISTFVIDAISTATSAS